MQYERPLPSGKFSGTELKDLGKAWIAITIAFTILFGRGINIPIWYTLLISFLTAGVGFLFHELGHKFVAQYYGYWAEFRASNKMLFIMILSSVVGFLIAAPGAVIIHGHVNRRYNGIISAAGPFVNLVLALLFLIMMLIAPGFWAIVGKFGLHINAFLGLFNMIPFGIFDGKKIKKWNEFVFWGLVVLLGGLLVIAYTI